VIGDEHHTIGVARELMEQLKHRSELRTSPFDKIPSRGDVQEQAASRIEWSRHQEESLTAQVLDLKSERREEFADGLSEVLPRCPQKTAEPAHAFEIPGEPFDLFDSILVAGWHFCLEPSRGHFLGGWRASVHPSVSFRRILADSTCMLNSACRELPKHSMFLTLMKSRA
jgi:hypothetical protein